MSSRITRRSFLRNAAGAGAGLVILSNPASVWSFAANEAVAVAQVGVAGRGSWFVESILNRPSLRPVALCDVDTRRAAKAYEKYPHVPKFQDFRRMLDQQKDIEGVIVATPEFSRATIMAACIKAEKHVYGEKPLTRTPYESRVMRELATKHKVATQQGNQGSQDPRHRQAVALVQAGLLGEVREVHVWNSATRPEGDAPPEGRGDARLPSGAQPVPEYLDWDLWLGRARWREFNQGWYGGWRGFRDFGTSGLGWWGPHCANLPFRALKLVELWDATDLTPQQRSIRVTPTVPGRFVNGFPTWEMVRYDVPARGNLPPLTWTWHKGAMHFAEKALGQHPEWRDMERKPWWVHSGSVFIGSKGKLDATEYGAIWRVFPDELKSSPQIQGIRAMGHEEEWLAACRGRVQCWSRFEQSGPLNEFLMLGNVATLVAEPFTYDPVVGKVLDNDAAQAALHYEYREGWSL